MFKIPIAFTALSALLLFPLAAAAQEADAPPRPFVYSTYYECDATEQWLADMIVETVYKPVYDAAVEDGTLSAWGWLAHHTGGKWRRAFYYTAATFDALLEDGDAVGEKIGESNAEAARKLGQICGVHEDYIWQTVNGSGGASGLGVEAAPSKAGVSMYMVCDMAKQERADELMAVFAPVYNSHVKEGELSSWGWLEHSVGGEYRRLLTMRAADTKAVNAGWTAVSEEIDKDHEAESNEFSEICYTHQDYIWDILH